MEKLIRQKYKLAIACMCKEVMHGLEDLRRLGALDKDSLEQIVAVFEINIKKRGILPSEKEAIIEKE